MGGYENTLLGYRSRLYRGLYESGMNMDMIDVVMFGKYRDTLMTIGLLYGAITPGHVIYTMAVGREFSSALPNKDEYQDSAVKDVLAVVFESAESSSTPKKAVKKVRHMSTPSLDVLLHYIVDHETQVL